MSKEIKFPLSKAQRTKFENDYELIFFKKPVHNISDEKLVEAVQANQSKIGSNAKNAQQQPPQEGTQNESGQDGKGIEANENEPDDEIRGMILKQENHLTASKDYFDLFGKKPLDDMTTEQILSANENEKARISEANTKKPKAKAEEIKFNPATEMLIQRKGEKRVINKQTFQFIKNDGWEEVVETPSELLNK